MEDQRVIESIEQEIVNIASLLIDTTFDNRVHDIDALPESHYTLKYSALGFGNIHISVYDIEALGWV